MFFRTRLAHLVVSLTVVLYGVSRGHVSDSQGLVITPQSVTYVSPYLLSTPEPRDCRHRSEHAHKDVRGQITVASINYFYIYFLNVITMFNVLIPSVSAFSYFPLKTHIMVTSFPATTGIFLGLVMPPELCSSVGSRFCSGCSVPEMPQG